MGKPSVSVYQRQKEFSKLTYISQGKLFCSVCKCTLPHDRVSSMKDHFKSDKHGKLEKLEANTGLKQPTIVQAVSEIRRYNDVRTTHLMQLSEALVTANIPLTKMDHPKLKAYLEENIKELGQLPSSGQMRRYYLPPIFRAHKQLLKDILADCACASVVADESPDFLSRKILNIMLIYFTAPTTEPDSAKVLLLDSVQLDEVNHKTVSAAVMKVLKDDYEFDFQKINAFISDNAAYMTKAYNDVLQLAFPNAEHVTCTAHILDLGVQDFIANIPIANSFIAAFKMVFSGNNSDRKFRYKAHLAANNRRTKLAPESNTNRWNSWLKAALYHAENIHVYKEFFAAEHATHPTSACLKNVLNMLDDAETFDCFADITVAGGFIVQCLTKNEGLWADIFSQISDIESTLFWCRAAAEEMTTDAVKKAINGYADTVEAYYFSENRFRQPASRFMQAVRAFDPNYLSSCNVDKELIFENCKRFRGEQLKFGAEINKYYEFLREKKLIVVPGEHPIDFWSRVRHLFPVLAPAAIFCLAMPANSVAVERSFSQGRDVLTKKRNRLSMSNLALYNMLYQNFKATNAYNCISDDTGDEDSIIVDC